MLRHRLMPDILKGRTRCSLLVAGATESKFRQEKVKMLDRVLLRSLLIRSAVFLLLACCVRAQYVIETVKGIDGLSPSGMAIDSSGSLYFSAAHRVYRLTGSGELSVFAGVGAPAYIDDNISATRAGLHSP